MKISTICFLLCAMLVGTGARAQTTTTYDSVPATIVLASYAVDVPENALGAPDYRQATLGSSGFLMLGFGNKTQYVTFDKGSTIHLYFTRISPLSDSTAARIQFIQLDQDLHTTKYGDTVFVSGATPPGQRQMLDLTVPEEGMNAIQIEVAVNGVGGGAITFSLDGAMLIQRVTLGVKNLMASRALLSGYPNPFRADAGTTLRVSIPQEGMASIEIRDMLGRVVRELPIGRVTEGEQELRFDMPEQGLFLARLKIDGNVVGAPLKLSAE